MSAVAHDVHHGVAEVLVRYATGIDRRDWPLFRTCFTDDCDLDYGPIGTWRGGDEVTAWMRQVHEPCGRTMHRITNIAVEPSSHGVTARSYVDALVMLPGDETGTHAVGYYDDELVDTGDGWRIARRRFTPVLVRLVPDGTVIRLGG